MTSPIRVGLIGLGRALSMDVPGSWAAVAHLPYLRASPQYQLVALANSSVKSAEESIAFHKLGPEVKAYGSAEDLAADPNVDLVVVSVVVAKHYNLAKPALLAGKNVFVEWPLGKTTAEAQELTELAQQKGVKTLVGTQGRATALVVKLKELIQGGQIGTVTSTIVTGSFGVPTGMWIEGAEYYLDDNSGGNTFRITFGHFLDSFTHVLGPFAELSSVLNTAYKTVNIISPTTGQLVSANFPKSAPDYIAVQGVLASGATASLAYRITNGATIDGVGTRWLITGTKGEIEVTIPEIQWQFVEGKGVVLRVKRADSSSVETVDVGGETVEGVEGLAVNTGRLYRAFADADVGVFSDFGRALETHQLLDRIHKAAGR